MKKLLTFVAILGIVSIASAATFTADGSTLDPTHGYTTMDRIGLVSDGSFEAGCDVYWLCATDVTCVWITDLVPLGLWNYDGNMVAWLGGYCGTPACYQTFTQDIVIDGGLLSWYWMGYINNGDIMTVYITVDGTEVYSYVPQLTDHLLDYQQASCDVSAFNDGGMHTVVIGQDNPSCVDPGVGDNYFLDYVELAGGTATQETTFSSVKSLY